MSTFNGIRFERHPHFFIFSKFLSHSPFSFPPFLRHLSTVLVPLLYIFAVSCYFHFIQFSSFLSGCLFCLSHFTIKFVAALNVLCNIVTQETWRPFFVVSKFRAYEIRRPLRKKSTLFIALVNIEDYSIVLPGLSMKFSWSICLAF